MILPPKRGGTYLYCPACPRWRTRTLRQYARHWERRHYFHRTARIIAAAGPLYVAAAGTQPSQAGWVKLGTAYGFGLTFNQPSGLLLNERHTRMVQQLRGTRRS